MPRQWRDLKTVMLDPYEREFYNQRCQTKSDHCMAYIADFKERHCDFSAFADDRDLNLFNPALFLFIICQKWKG